MEAAEDGERCIISLFTFSVCVGLFFLFFFNFLSYDFDFGKDTILGADYDLVEVFAVLEESSGVAGLAVVVFVGCFVLVFQEVVLSINLIE